VAVTFPGTKLAITVQLFGIVTAGVWTDVSTYVFKADKIKIKHGLSPNDQSHDGTFDYCDLTLDNADRRFSPRNMNGPYFSRLTINTPMRVYWNCGNGDVFRFQGVVPNWDPKFPAGDRRYLRIQATDDRRRMQIGPGLQVTESPIYTSTIKAAGLVSYMPLQDGAGTDSPTLIGGGHVAVNGTINYGSDSTLPGSEDLPTFSATGYIILTGASHTYGGHWQADWFDKIDAAPAGTTTLKRIWVNSTGASLINFWDVELTSTTYAVKAYDRNGSVIVNSGTFTIAALFPGTWMHMRLMAQNASSSTFDWQFVTFQYDLSNGAVLSGSGVTGQAGNLGAMSIGMAQAGYDGFATGHVAFYDAYNFSAVDSSGNAYNGEAPGTRWSRILDEQGIPNSRRVGVGSDTVAMGRQTSNDVMTNLRECLIANEGFMDGFSTANDDGELRFTERSYLENRTSAEMTLNYASRVFAELEPSDTDDMIVNDWTARRTGGASARVVQEHGPRNVMLPADNPLGVGRYAGGQDYSLSTDAQALDHAGWAVSLGTVDEPRIINAELWFERPGMSALLTTWESLDTWRRFQITNPPTDVGSETLDLLIAGYEEEFDQFGIHVKINARPFSPYKVGILDSSAGATSDQRLDSEDTRTVSIIASGDTTMRIYNTGIQLDATPWTHADGDYGVRVGGEVMTVTAISTLGSFIGAGAAQTSNNAAIVGVPIHASTVKGDAMYLVAGSRNVSVDMGFTPPAGWDPLVNNLSSLKIWGRMARGGDTAPTVTPTGGAAGDDVLAQIYTFRGGTVRQFPPDGDASVTVSGSAADIAYSSLTTNRDSCLFLLAGLRMDDWTGGAAPVGFTECGDFSATAGNDAGLWVGYQFAGASSENVAAGSIVITGGVSAASRSVLIAVDTNVQQMTITRGVNNGGVGIAHDADLEVHVTNPIILGV
jgi:hypothetical protein